MAALRPRRHSLTHRLALETTSTMQRTFRSFADKGMLQRPWFWALMTGVLAILLGAVVFIVQTLPPHSLVLATGPEGGAYHQVGLRYREILAKDGVDLQLRP